MSTHKTRHSFSSMLNDILRIERYILHVAINKLYLYILSENYQLALGNVQ